MKTKSKTNYVKYNLPVCFVLAIWLLFLLFGCGTRRVESEKKTDIDIQNTYQSGEKIILGNTFTYKPFDALKPMVIQGKTYVNAIVSNDKTIVKEKWNNKYITKTITIQKTKQTDKTDNTILWVLIAFIGCLFVFLYFWLPKLKF